MNLNEKTKARTVLLLGLGLCLPYGCDDGVDANVGDEVVPCEWADSMTEATQEMTAWPATGTVSKPAFGKGCRYSVETTYELASNCEKDDAIDLEGPPDGAVNLSIILNHEGSEVFNLSVELQRSLVGKAYDTAAGTASWLGEDPFGGNVVDGTLCFSEKLAPNTAVSGEFSMIIEDETGVQRSVGGRFLFDGQEIVQESPLSVISTNADIDLR